MVSAAPAPPTNSVTIPSLSSGSALPALGPASVRIGQNARPELHATSCREGEIGIDGDGGDPAWSRAAPTTFDTDYRGRATGTFTRVRLAWSNAAVYGLFELDGAGLATDTARPTDVERERLYEEDCVEVFLTPDPGRRDRYYEIEIGPYGHLFDLDVHKGGRSDVSWSSRATIGTQRDAGARRATIEVRIGAAEIARVLAPSARLPLAIYRMEGKGPRHYLAWSPPRTSKPSFHEPEAFGSLVLDP